ncbi:hepatic sodium/bile acid cotransporter-like [Myxocyprinus asiaticus]|uniref:hepatic sodium/bile acid cotransporter-like n=1 Tax=Myxocyprinus asiaticus TaxID=70543 RepID=UPI002222B70D|nr:hepatic sodium/bile acid cotransporter-like [Myxocyprinus asiaticus]
MMVTINSSIETNFSSFDRNLNTTVLNDSQFVYNDDVFIRFALIVILFITMVSLGCTLKISQIKKHLIRPKGVAIVVEAQFRITPLTAFSLAKLFQLGPMESDTVLICGCCPGGNLSNIFTLVLQGDMNLSILMTTCSTALALGMMPLLIYLYCHGFSHLENIVPYNGITLARLTLVPCSIGILINHHAPQYSKIITTGGMTITLISSVIIGILTAVIDRGSVFIVTSQLIAIAALMPLNGYICGYILSTLFKMSASCRRTIAVEVDCQNNLLCTTILKVAFPSELIVQLYLFPIVYMLLQSAEAIIFIILFRCLQRLKSSQKETKVYIAEEGEAEETNGDI